MSASFANATNQTNLCDGFNEVRTQLGESKFQDMQRANGTESLPINRTRVRDANDAPNGGGDDLAREESKVVSRAQGASNELDNQSFVKMSSQQSASRDRAQDTSHKAADIGDSPKLNASHKPSSQDELGDVYAGHEQEFGEHLEDGGSAVDRGSNSTSNKHIEYDDDDDADLDSSTSASVSNQSVELESLLAPDSSLDLNRRAGQQGNLLAALGSPLTSELRRLRQSGVKKVQQALRHNRRRRRRRKPASNHKKRETTSLPMALIKSMQTRQGLMSGGVNSGATSSGGVQSIGRGGLFHSNGAPTTSQHQQQSLMSPLMRQLAAANPLKQQLASGSMHLSTTIQRLLASKFGAANNQTQAARPATKLMLHNNNNSNHLLGSLDEDQAVGGDYSATSASSAGEQLSNLLAASQQDHSSSPSGHSLAGHTDSQQHGADFLADMQTHHNLQRPQSPSLGALEDDAAPPIHRPGHSLADYQSSASTQADRLAELIGQWSGQQQQQQQQHPQASSPINAGHQQDDTLKLSQLVAAATAAAAAASGQSSAPTAPNKQLIPIEIIGLDPSVTNSILYGPAGQYQQQRQPGPVKQGELLDETPGGGVAGPAAASELDLQENPQHFQAPASLRHYRHPPVDQAPAYADNSQTGADSSGEASGESASSSSSGESPAPESQTAREKVSRQTPSSVLHIHHFHHTQPAASALGEQQQSGASGNSESSEQPESGAAEQQPPGEGGKEAEASQISEEAAGQRPRAGKVPRTSSTSEAPRVVLVSGAGSGAAPSQENAQEEPKQVPAWPTEGAEQQSQSDNHIEGGTAGEDESEADRSPGLPLGLPKRMRFVTRNSLRQRQQQQQQSGYQNLTYVNSHSHDGVHNLPSHMNTDQQQIFVNNQQYQLQRPLMSRPNQNQRRPGRYNTMLLRQPTPPHFNDLLNPANEQTDPQQALADSPDSQGMLMVAYRPTGTVVPTSSDHSQMLPPFYDHLSNNRSFPAAASGHHNTFIRQTPYNEGSESKTPGQLLMQRPHPNSTQLLMRPQMGSRVPSPNLLKNLIKYPKMNEALLMQQLHSSNQSASPYWSNEDERLLAQFNLVNAPGQLKIAPANLVQASNTSLLDAYPNQLIDNLSLMSRLNYSLGNSPQLLQQLQPAPGLEQANSSQRLTSDDLAQAAKQLQYQNQIKQQQHAQVASLLLNNLAAGGTAHNPFLGKMLANSSNPGDAAGLMQANSSKNGRFEMTMASDRLPSKFPVSRNASTINNNVRMTKHFHLPETSFHDRETNKALESNMENQHPKVPSTGEHSVHVQTSTPKHTGPQVVVENILDSAHGLGNLALGFIFFVSLMTFVLILASLIYRRRRAIGSARCGLSAMRRDDDANSSSHPKGAPLEGSGRKSLRCLNNLTQRTKHLMRTNFSGANSTSNVIAGSTPLSSLKSLNHLDSSLTSDSRNHPAQADDHRANKAMQMAAPQVVKQRTSQLLESSNKSRHGWEVQDDRATAPARPSKYSCPNQGSSTVHAKVSTFNVSSRLINGPHHSGIEKYSTPDESDQATSSEHPNSGIRTLNTRFHKNAYLQKSLATSATTSSHDHVRSSNSHQQPSKATGKKHQQYNRSSPASMEMPQSQAKYVNTQVQLRNANL